MARKTTGKLYTSGKKGYYYFRFTTNGKDCRIRLLDIKGKPITTRPEAEKAAERILKPITESDRAEQYRMLKNNLRDAEDAAEQANRDLKNTRAAITDGWNLFMKCSSRPASCKRYSINEIPPHTTPANYRAHYSQFVAWIKANHPGILLLSEITLEHAEEYAEYLKKKKAFKEYFQ